MPSTTHRYSEFIELSAMFAIIGIVVVFGAIVAGYLMEHGNLQVLMQHAELVIIGGAALGTALIGNPLHILKKMVSGVAGVFGGSKFSKQVYLDSLKTVLSLNNMSRVQLITARLPLQTTSSLMSIELCSVLREASSGSSEV
jgi:motility protein A